MRILKIYDRQRNKVKNISSFEYSSLSKTGISEVIIPMNPKDFKDMIVEVYDHKEAKISGLIKKYSWNKENNSGTLYIYPLLWDLHQDYITDPQLTAPGNGIYYISSSIEGVMDQIMTQYLSKVTDPILKKGSFAVTGRNVVFTFKYTNLFEALVFLQDKMLEKGFYIDVDINGKLSLVNYSGTIDLKHKIDTEYIDFDERTDENIKKVIFDNKQPIENSNRIFKEYNNPDITTGRAIYIADSRFKDEDSVDDYIQNMFDTEGSGIIEVNNIISNVDVPLYSKVSIYNWEKNFGEIYVIEKEYLSSGKYNLKVGNNPKFVSPFSDIVNSLDNSISEIEENLGIPQFIQETYIDSVEIRSPTISGNNGKFSGTVKIGASGIVIDGVNKSIYSNNYNATNKTGFFFKEDGKFLLGKNTTNFLSFNGTDFEFSGTINASASSVINFDSITGTNKPANNATAGATWGVNIGGSNLPASGATVGANWNTNLANIPTNITNPSYITSTKITSTTIESPAISGNTGKFSGTFKVGTNGIEIDGVNKFIQSSNFSSGNTGWKIDNNGTAEFGNITARGTLKTALSGKRVEISSATNRMSVFSDLGSEVMNVGYNSGAFNNLIWGDVGFDGYTGPLIWLKSQRNANTAYFEGSSTNFPVVFSKTQSSSSIGFETNGRIVANGKLDVDGNITTGSNFYGSNIQCGITGTSSYGEIFNGRGFFGNGIQTNGGDVKFLNSSKIYLRFSNTYLEVGGSGELYWYDGLYKYQIDMTVI